MKKIFSTLLAVLIFANTIGGFFVQSVSISNNKFYTVISNESVDAENVSSTGSFAARSAQKAKLNNLNCEPYMVDFVMPLNEGVRDISPSKKSKMGISSNSVGDTKVFWVYNIETESYYQIQATLRSQGQYCDVWVNLDDYNMSESDADKISREFDEKMYLQISDIFGPPSDVDGNGKVNILCFDIQDGFDGQGGFTAGYFDPNDLFENDPQDNPNSNCMEVFYIDTYPGMGLNQTDVTYCFEIIAHEFQHMVNFNSSVLIEKGDQMDSWLDEGLAEAAAQVYHGKVLQERINYYNRSDLITSGFSLLRWEGELENYSLSYLFIQYLKEQAGIGNEVFTKVINSPYNDYRAVEQVIKTYIDPNKTFGQFMTDFRAALFLKNSSGPYGFKGNKDFDSIDAKIYQGGKTDLYGGGAVVIESDSIIEVPSDKGPSISYLILSSDGKSELINVINSAKNLFAGNYTVGTWNSLQVVLNSAIAVRDNPDALQPDIEAATQVLIEAIDSLQHMGDLNFSKTVTAIDALWVLQSVSEKRELNSYQIEIGDVNRSGSITTIDVVIILKFISGNIEHF